MIDLVAGEAKKIIIRLLQKSLVWMVSEEVFYLGDCKILVKFANEYYIMRCPMAHTSIGGGKLC